MVTPRAFDVMPNGNLIGIVGESAEGRAGVNEIRVVVNWFEELKRMVPHGR